jgi:hypothetical protein
MQISGDAIDVRAKGAALDRKKWVKGMTTIASSTYQRVGSQVVPMLRTRAIQAKANRWLYIDCTKQVAGRQLTAKDMQMCFALACICWAAKQEQYRVCPLS